MSVKISRFGRLQDVATGWRTLATMGLISCSTSQNDGYFFWLYPYEKYGIDKHFQYHLKMGQEIQIFFDDIEIGKNMTLSGCICNQRKLLGSIVYGVKFDSFGIESGKHLFTYLEFNGQIMVARYGSNESHDNA